MKVPSIFCSQEIDSRHVTGHRSIDYSRNSCRMCHFCHAQLLEITDAANIKSTLVQHSCRNVEVVEAFCPIAASRRNTRRSIHQPPVAALHAPAEMHTALFSVPQYADNARRLVLASRIPSRAAPALNPHSARCLAGAQLPATSCLGAFRPPPSECVERPSLRQPKTCTIADMLRLIPYFASTLTGYQSANYS